MQEQLRRLLTLEDFPEGRIQLTAENVVHRGGLDDFGSRTFAIDGIIPSPERD